MADLPDTVKLDRSVANSEKFIADIKATLTEQSHNLGDAADSWLSKITQVELKRKSPRFVIGVVGATGSGKSSIINAVLGETQLVPTNCMRACTAVVTEISYNDTPSNYRAVIEFVSPQQWRTELEILLGDVVTGGKIAGKIDDDGSEAGIALAKIQAVYPHLNQNNLANASVTELLDCDYIRDLVGHEIEVNTSTAKELYTDIQKYVDSKEKLSADFVRHGLRASSALDEIAYWPLIRAVRIQTKAAVLKSGSVLVDLPGIADSNAARAAIAQKYLQNCAALWVVAPIIRAVDDKSARLLLGESFKRQMWRDGTLQRITFICSKTDEISISEAREVLKRYDGIKDKLAKVDEDLAATMEQQGTLLRSLREVKQKIDGVSKLQGELEQEEKEYKTLETFARDGQPCHPLVQIEVYKRQADGKAEVSPTKKAKYEIGLGNSFGSSNNHESPVFTNAETFQVQYRQDATQPQLDLPSIKKKLVDLKTKKRAVRAEKKGMKSAEKSLKQAMTGIKARIAGINAQEWITCVLGRNEISSNSIRIDFALGVKDITRDEKGEDEEEEEKEEEGEREETANSGDEIRLEGPGALPVFCVSARGYHKISGNMSGEKIATRFTSLEDTGIPALREHVVNIGHEESVTSLQRYVDETQRLLTSLRMWSSGNRNDNFTGGDTYENKVEDICMKLVDDFVSGILRTATSTMDAVTKSIDSEVLAGLGTASKSASKATIATALRWVAPPKADANGLRYETFKAVVRRDGVFTKYQKTHNFNADLSQLYMRRLDNRWNEVFNVRIDKIFSKALKDGDSALGKFVASFGDRLNTGQNDTTSTVRQIFEEQVSLFAKDIAATFKTARKSIEDQQKEANRLEDSIKTQMKRIYSDLEDVKGKGSYDRCREKLKAHLEENKVAMFNKISRKLTTSLQAMSKEVRTSLIAQLEANCDSLRRDCRNLCQHSRDFEALPDLAQKMIVQVLATADVKIDSYDNDETMTDEGGEGGGHQDTGRGQDRVLSPSFSLRSMTPVLMRVKKEDSNGSEAESESSSSDDSDDDDE